MHLSRTGILVLILVGMAAGQQLVSAQETSLPEIDACAGITPDPATGERTIYCCIDEIMAFMNANLTDELYLFLNALEKTAVLPLEEADVFYNSTYQSTIHDYFGQTTPCGPKVDCEGCNALESGGLEQEYFRDLVADPPPALPEVPESPFRSAPSFSRRSFSSLSSVPSSASSQLSSASSAAAVAAGASSSSTSSMSAAAPESGSSAVLWIAILGSITAAVMGGFGFYWLRNRKGRNIRIPFFIE